MDMKFASLRKFNFVMGFFHLAQAVAMLVLSSDFTLPINASFLRFNVFSQKLVPNTETLIEIRLGPLIATFLLVSAIAHFLISLPRINKWYNANLAKGINYARWLEYSVSSSIMIIVIAMLVGIYDIVSLLLLFFLNAMMILFGWMMEKHNQTTKKTDWTSFYFGCIAAFICWVSIAFYLFGIPDKAPAFVYWIYFSIFLFFNVFDINMILQYKKIGKWEDYLYGERAYIILSLVAKSLLAWQVWAGTLRPV